MKKAVLTCEHLRNTLKQPSNHKPTPETYEIQRYHILTKTFRGNKNKIEKFEYEIHG